MNPQSEANGSSSEVEGENEKGLKVSYNLWDCYGEPFYITGALRANAWNQVYLFMGNEYLLFNYEEDQVIDDGPRLVCCGFNSLIGTAFGESGIECAIDIDYEHSTEAFIFCENLTAHIDYANDKVIRDNMVIRQLFPFLVGTVFENHIDAAFTAKESEAEPPKSAYLFKGDHYALINYGQNARLIAMGKITERFPSLRNTIFETGIDAAFSSHSNQEQVYLFKKDQYALFNYGPGTTDDYIIGGVKPILSNWHSLRTILPRENAGIDFHDHDIEPRELDDDEYEAELMKSYRICNFSSF
ncbi:hypothetical protein REPUB_Repub05bG0047000 [Reevesia pubescens]